MYEKQLTSTHNVESKGSSEWSWRPDIIFRQLDDNAAGNDVVAGSVVCEEEDSQADGKEKRQREVLDCRSHNSAVYHTVNARPVCSALLLFHTDLHYPQSFHVHVHTCTMHQLSLPI